MVEKRTSALQWAEVFCFVRLFSEVTLLCVIPAIVEGCAVSSDRGFHPFIRMSASSAIGQQNQA